MIKNKYLIKYRIRNQLSQRAMAEFLGIPYRTYQSYEDMKTGTSETMLKMMELINNDKI